MNPTIKESTIRELSNGRYEYAGSLSSRVGAMSKHKSSIVERRFREMSSGIGSDGKPCEIILKKRYVDNPAGKGAKVVQYALIDELITSCDNLSLL